MKCLVCEKDIKDVNRECYKSPRSNIFNSYDKNVPIHRDCVNDMFKHWNYKHKDEELAMFLTCCMMDFHFNSEIYNSLRNNPRFSPAMYFKQMNFSESRPNNFMNTLLEIYERLEEDVSPTNQRATQDETPQDTVSLMVEREVELTEEDENNRQYIIDIVGYDPFMSYVTKAERKILYSETVRFFNSLSDVDEDMWMVSQIIQIVNNNHQIRTYDNALTKLDITSDSDVISEINKVKKSLSDSNDKIAKENRISVRNRSDKEVGKSTLSYMMRDLREKGFERAEVDYYDQLKSKGTRWAIDMSHQSLLENGFFDENDFNEMMVHAREQMELLQERCSDLEEEKRLLAVELQTLKAKGGDSHD